MADALASLITMPMKPLVLLKLSQSCYKSGRVMKARVDSMPWFYDIKQYLDRCEYPIDTSEIDKTVIQKLAVKFTYHQGVLYKRTLDGM